MSEQAFINGFLKRAADYGVSEAEAIELLKIAKEKTTPRKRVRYYYRAGAGGGLLPAALLGGAGVVYAGKKIYDGGKKIHDNIKEKKVDAPGVNTSPSADAKPLNPVIARSKLKN